MGSPQKYELERKKGASGDENTPPENREPSVFSSNISDWTSVGVLPDELIKYLKSYKNWCYTEESHISPWTLNEEQIRCLYMQYSWLNVDEIHLVLANNEEIVWEDDIWRLKDIKEIPDA